jgi:tRNA (guanine37-N1)-methyltransferase
MRFDVVTLFPGMFEGVLTESILKRGREKGLIDIRLHDLRDFTHDKHRQVDDTPTAAGRNGPDAGPHLRSGGDD